MTHAEAAGVDWHVVTDDVVSEVADSVTPQGLVARCHSIVLSLAELPSDVGFVVVCADVRDPGNAGAVIRCADAAGADAVVLAGDSVDPLNPKAVRASAGSLFHLPIAVHRDVPEALGELRSRGLQVFAADASGERHIFDTRVDAAAAHGVGLRQRGLGAARSRRSRWPTPWCRCPSSAGPRA